MCHCCRGHVHAYGGPFNMKSRPASLRCASAWAAGWRSTDLSCSDRTDADTADTCRAHRATARRVDTRRHARMRYSPARASRRALDTAFLPGTDARCCDSRGTYSAGSVAGASPTAAGPTATRARIAPSSWTRRECPETRRVSTSAGDAEIPSYGSRGWEHRWLTGTGPGREFMRANFQS